MRESMIEQVFNTEQRYLERESRLRERESYRESYGESCRERVSERTSDVREIRRHF